MFTLFERLFHSRHPAAKTASHVAKPAQANAAGPYLVVAPVWRIDDRRAVYRGLSGDAIAIVKNRDQALTLQDTLNLASGGRPSRRLLDAIYLEEPIAAETGNKPQS
jgi:hypothetical protein